MMSDVPYSPKPNHDHQQIAEDERWETERAQIHQGMCIAQRLDEEQIVATIDRIVRMTIVEESNQSSC